MAFGRALMLNPNDPVVLNNFALAHLQAGNLDQAEALLLRASSSAETFPKVAQNLALVRKMRGDAPVEAPTPQVFPTAVLPAPPEEMPESGAAAPMHGAEVASPEERLAPADVEVTEARELLAEATESSVVTSDVDAPNADLADSVDDPIIENEVIETVALEAPEPVEEAVQEIVAPIEKPAQQEAVVETVASDVVEPLPAAPVWDIWIPSSGPIYLQVGAFSSDENAARMVEKLEILEPQMASANAGERMIHRIVVGPYANRDETHVALGALTEFGIDDVQVLTRLPGVVQQREDIAEAAPSAAPADKVASENVTVPGGSTSLSYVDSF
jgi:cell division septation protein DedD